LRPLETAFPEYKGSKSAAACTSYIAEQFQAQLPSGRRRAHVIALTATLKRGVQTAFDAIVQRLQLDELESPNIVRPSSSSSSSSSSSTPQPSSTSISTTKAVPRSPLQYGRKVESPPRINQSNNNNTTSSTNTSPTTSTVSPSSSLLTHVPPIQAPSSSSSIVGHVRKRSQQMSAIELLRASGGLTPATASNGGKIESPSVIARRLLVDRQDGLAASYASAAAALPPSLLGLPSSSSISRSTPSTPAFQRTSLFAQALNSANSSSSKLSSHEDTGTPPRTPLIGSSRAPVASLRDRKGGAEDPNGAMAIMQLVQQARAAAYGGIENLPPPVTVPTDDGEDAYILATPIPHNHNHHSKRPPAAVQGLLLRAANADTNTSNHSDQVATSSSADDAATKNALLELIQSQRDTIRRLQMETETKTREYTTAITSLQRAKQVQAKLAADWREMESMMNHLLLKDLQEWIHDTLLEWNRSLTDNDQSSISSSSATSSGNGAARVPANAAIGSSSTTSMSASNNISGGSHPSTSITNRRPPSLVVPSPATTQYVHSLAPLSSPISSSPTASPTPTSAISSSSSSLSSNDSSIPPPSPFSPPHDTTDSSVPSSADAGVIDNESTSPDVRSPSSFTPQLVDAVVTSGSNTKAQAARKKKRLAPKRSS
jgi:hypothetical protein